MNALRILDQGILYRNRHPGHRAVIAYAPFVQPLSGEELICVFRHGQAMYSRDGMIHQLRSSDGGKTWEHEGPIRDRSRDDSHYNYRGAQITALHDGSLVMKVNRAEHSDPDHFYFNQETGGISHCQTSISAPSTGAEPGRPASGQLAVPAFRTGAGGRRSGHRTGRRELDAGLRDLEVLRQCRAPPE